MRRRLPIATVLAAALAGCVATPLGTARTLAPGATQHEVGFGLNAYDGFEWYWPAASWSYRYGVRDGVEAGAGLRAFGPEVDLKVALLRTEAVALAIDPTVLIVAFQRPSASLPMLFDLELGSRFTLVLSAAPTVGAPFDDAALATGAGVKVRVAEGFALQPTAQWIGPMDERFPYADEGLAFFGLGFLFRPGANEVD